MRNPTASAQAYDKFPDMLFDSGVARIGNPSNQADHDSPDPLLDPAFEQKPDAQVPLELAFRDENARPVRLGDLLNGKPTILMFAYYECPMLCSLVLNDLSRTMQALPYEIGQEFEVITVSMDPGETPALAAAKKASYIHAFGRPEAAEGWHFLTGEQVAISRLAETVGFHYVYDSTLDQYAHPAGIIVLTPGGRISRYLFGIDYSPTELRLALVEASEQKIASPVDRFILLCYAYDPQTGRYTFLIHTILRVASSATAAALGILVLILSRRGKGRTS
jgi:protein SCO1/2